jgi:DNA-binding transcriptional ArsR family regulator
VLVVTRPDQLRALGGEPRLRIVAFLRERAASTTELAADLQLAKGTVGHHLKVLEEAGLIRVVRTRRVRAVTERFYGRVARLFVIKGAEEGDALTQVRVRLDASEAQRFERRLERLVRDFRLGNTAGGVEYELVIGLHQTGGHA